MNSEISQITISINTLEKVLSEPDDLLHAGIKKLIFKNQIYCNSKTVKHFTRDATEERLFLTWHC